MPAKPVPINPEELGAPRGYSHGVLGPSGGRMLFVAGQIGWDAEQQMGDGLVEQFEQALANVMTVVQCAAGEPESVARMTIYVVDREAYRRLLPELGAAYRRVMGRHYPAMALVEVGGLLEPGALVEVEATAILPPVANE